MNPTFRIGAPCAAAPTPTRLAAWLFLAAACGAPPAQASCGAAACSLMTDRYAQGAGATHAGWSTDLRLEAVTQDRLRSGTTTIDASQVTGEEAIERRTRNLNLLAGLTWGLDADWSFTLRLPLVRRDHQHDLVDETTGGPSTPERWRFTKAGDAQLLARRQFAGVDARSAFALFAGLKLPTGSTRVTNDEGGRAERALQPGTGTTDLVVGAAWRRAVAADDACFGQASVSLALNSHESFKPGRRLELSAGWSHAFAPAFGGVLQVNARQRGRDRGDQAEPDNSGSTTLDVSPGLTLAVGHASTLYAYLQLPVYQKVNGIQLVPRKALAAGWTSDF